MLGTIYCLKHAQRISFRFRTQIGEEQENEEEEKRKLMVNREDGLLIVTVLFSFLLLKLFGTGVILSDLLD